MRKFKKLTAMLITAIMVIATCVPVLAATPVPTDTQEASVTNVEATATVTAYQITTATYNASGFVGYVAAPSVTLADVHAPTSSEVTAIARTGLSGLTSVTMTSDPGTPTTFSADLTAGYWVVVVSGNIEDVYNPMLIGVYYSVAGSDNTMVGGIVDSNSNWTLETINAYAKSTTPSITKSIVNSDGNANGDAAAIGDNVDFKIETTLPSYSEQYTSVLVQIQDTFSAGLALDMTSIVVTAGGTTLVEPTHYTVTSSAGGFVLTMDSDYVLANGGQVIEVDYSATLTAAAGINFNPNTNKAELVYTNDPNNSSNTSTTEDITYHYTFGIGVSLFGDSTEIWNVITQELVKGHLVDQTAIGGTTNDFVVLPGATFELTNNATNVVYTATSNTTGHLSFTGLDAGSYTLRETIAPPGFTLNATPMPVVITPTFNANGTLASYTITINGTATSTYTAVYDGGTSTITDIIVNEAETTEFINTTLNELPSTGGIGTYIFTILGVTIISVATLLLFVSKKKKL